jgi:hypothetical protein
MEDHILLPQSKLQEITSRLDEINTTIRESIGRQITFSDWIPEKEAQKLLGLKATSLWALRRKKKIAFSKVGSKTFYSLKSISKLLDKNQE